MTPGGRVLIEELWIPCPADMFGPRPKGSLEPVGNRYRKGPVKLVESVADSTRWKTVMTNALQVAVSDHVDPPTDQLRGVGAVWLSSIKEWRRMRDGFPFAGDVAVAALFLFARRPVDIREGRERPTGDRLFGDTDKLCRNLGDAIEAAGVLKDDRQISTWEAGKRFQMADAPADMRAGVWVTIREDSD